MTFLFLQPSKLQLRGFHAPTLRTPSKANIVVEEWSNPCLHFAATRTLGPRQGLADLHVCASMCKEKLWDLAFA
jgi:hypothetical protein